MGLYFIFIWLFGSCMILLFLYLIANGYTLYKKYYSTYVSQGLKESFVFVNPMTLFIVNIIAILVFGLLALLILGRYGNTQGFIGAGITMFITALIPTIMINSIKSKREMMFIYQLPDALNSLSAALKGGANLTRGLELLATQQPIPLSQEFSIVLAEYKVGRDLDESLEDLHHRIPKQELELMSSAMSISRQVGGNLADTLTALAESLRQKAEVEGKIDALTSMGRAQGWVMGLIPFLVGAFMFKQEPESMMLLFTSPQGWITLGVIAIMLTLSVVIIRKIININV